MWLKKDTAGTVGTITLTLDGLGLETSLDIDVATELSYTEWRKFSISGTQSSGYNGIVSLKVNFVSTVANSKIYVTDISNPSVAPYNTGTFQFFDNGEPAKIITSNFTPASDVWDIITTDANAP